MGRRTVGIDAQLRMLVACGVRFAKGYNDRNAIDAILHEATRSELESNPYTRMLAALGTEEDPIAENIWHLSRRYIDGPDPYRRIAERLRDMTDWALELEDVAETANEGEPRKLTFKLDGTVHELVPIIDETRVDFTIVRRLNELLEARHPSKRLFFVDVDDCPVIVCITAENRSRLSREAGVDLEWVDMLQ
jgi:hypothetical protein